MPIHSIFSILEIALLSNLLAPQACNASTGSGTTSARSLAILPRFHTTYYSTLILNIILLASGVQCINMEWGNFGALAASRALLPRTRFDEALDKESLNIGEQLLEKVCVCV